MTTSPPAETSPRVFDVFLSYNAKEKKVVERLAERLKREAVEPWLDSWCLTPGGDWQDELAEGLRRSSSCAVFVGPGGVGDWERMELKLATDRMAKDRNFRVFIVLLPEVGSFETTPLPPFLSTRTWVDMRSGISEGRAFQMLINAVRGVVPGPEMPIAPRADICPYRGLHGFDEDHAEFFFGREGEVQRLVEKLKSTRFLTVLGPSGSGKSSIVRAGLVPALRKGALSDSDTWSIRVFMPGANPLTQLAASLVRLNPLSSAAKLLDELKADERALHLASSVALVEHPETERVVWIVDQFEEVFTPDVDNTERSQFIANLLYAAAVPGGRDVVVLTMRADFYQKCAVHRELAAQISTQQFLVGPMSREGLRQAIGEPAWRVGLEFESGLVETILDVVERQPGALPLLEYALLELWQKRRGRLLTLEAYRETGGVEGAIAKRADSIYESFDDERQAITRRVMLRLTQPGEGTEDTRRRATMAELITGSDDAEKVRDVVRALADARLLTTNSEGTTEIVDVSHEALIRSWPALRQWIEKDRQGLRTHRRLTAAAEEWQRSNRDEGLLFRGARLAQTTEWSAENKSALNDLELSFLAASTELADRERTATQRRTRRVVIGLIIALAAITSASIYGFIQNRLAARQGREVFARELASNAMAQLAVDPELGLLLAIKAAEKASTVETENALRQALVKSPAHILHVDDTALKALFSPDAKRVLTMTANNAQVWEVASGQKIFELSHDGALADVEYSPDGKLIATVMKDGTLQDYDAGSAQIIAKWSLVHPKGDETQFDLTFTSDSKYLLVDNGVSVTVREINDGRVVAELPGRSPEIADDGQLILTRPEDRQGLYVFDSTNWKNIAEMPSSSVNGHVFGALGPDGRIIVGVGEDRARIHQLNDKRLLQEFELPRESKLAKFSPDGKLLATTSGRTLVITDIASGQKIDFTEAPGPLESISFSPDGRFVLTTADVARLYDVKSREKRFISDLGVFKGTFGVDAEFSSDGKYVLTVNRDGPVFLWDLNVWSTRNEIKYGRDDGAIGVLVRSAAFNNDGKLLLTSESVRYPTPPGSVLPKYTFEIGVRDVDSGRTAGVYSRNILITAADWRSVDMSQDGRFVVSRMNKETVRIWDGTTGGTLAEISNGKEVTCTALSRDGKVVAVANRMSDGFGYSVTLYAVDDKHRLDEFQAGGYVTRLTFSPDGTRLLLITTKGAEMWEINSKRRMFGMRTTTAMRGGVFNSDGKLVLVWGATSKVLVMDATTGRIVSDLQGHVDAVQSASFSPDSKYVVTASGYESSFGPFIDIRQREERVPNGGNEVRVWDVSSGSTVYEFKGYNRRMSAAAFRPDGKSIQTCAEDGAVLVYSCDVCKPQAELLKMANSRSLRPLTNDERARYLHESAGN